MTIATLPPAPSRADAANADTFSEIAETFVAALPVFSTQVNNTLTDVNAAASGALASSNFKGSWAALTGAMSIPASVLHDDTLWLLVTNTSDIAADEPGVSAKWLNLAAVSGYVALVGAQTIAGNKTFTDTVTAGDFVGDGSGLTNVGVGAGQTWQNMIASRALDTNYTNSTGRPIMVSIGIVLTKDILSQGYVYVGGVMIAIVSNGDITTVANHEIATTVSFVVPPGAVYQLDNANGLAISTWTELR